MANRFWASNVVPLLLVMLHFLQHAITPAIYQIKLIALYAQPTLGSRTLLAGSGADADVAAALPSCYEDEHITATIRLKSTSSPKWLLQWCSPSLKATEPDDKFVVLRFLVAGIVQGGQLALLHVTGAQIARLVDWYGMSKFLGLLNLILPSTLTFLSTVSFFFAINCARKDKEIRTEPVSRIVMDVLRYCVCLMFLSFIVLWLRVLFA